MRMFLLVFFIVFLFSVSAHGEEEFFTVQAGSFSSFNEAKTNFLVLKKKLSNGDRDYLRVELVNTYYTLRIGKFNERKKAIELLKKVKNYYSSSLVLSAYVKEERIKELYKGEKKKEPPVGQMAKEGKKSIKKALVAQPKIRRIVNREDAVEYVQEEDTTPDETAFAEPSGDSVKTPPYTEGVAHMGKEHKAQVTERQPPKESKLYKGILFLTDRKNIEPFFPYIAIFIFFVLLLVLVTRKRVVLMLKIQDTIAGGRVKSSKSMRFPEDQGNDPRHKAKEMRRNLIDIAGDIDIQRIKDSGNLQIKSEKIKEGFLNVFTEIDHKSMELKAPAIVMNDLRIDEGHELLGDAYVKGNVYIDEEATIVVVAADGRLNAAAGLRVYKWVDAVEGITVGDNCNLGLSATTEGELLLGKGTIFEFVFGKPVRSFTQKDSVKGLEVDEQGLKVVTNPEDLGANVKELKHTLWYSKKDIIVPEGITLPKNLITNSNITIRCSSLINGYIKSHRSITIEDNVSVRGYLNAYGDVNIGKGSVIEGDIFSKGRIVIERGVGIGTKEKPVSVMSLQSVDIAEGVNIYGSVLAEAGGRVI